MHIDWGHNPIYQNLQDKFSLDLFTTLSLITGFAGLKSLMNLLSFDSYFNGIK